MAKLEQMISEAAEAVETFGEDELERFAAGQASFDTKLQAFADMIQRQLRARLTRTGMRADMVERYVVKIRPGRKYTKVDVGPEVNMSGKYMVDNETGEIFGIKGYGKAHKGHRYGTLKTVSDWYWGEYAGVKLSPKVRELLGKDQEA